MWVLLEVADHELGEWAAYFAAHSDVHAAAQAGRTSRVTVTDAEELFEQARRFVLHACQVISQDTHQDRVA